MLAVIVCSVAVAPCPRPSSGRGLDLELNRHLLPTVPTSMLNLPLSCTQSHTRARSEPAPSVCGARVLRRWPAPRPLRRARSSIGSRRASSCCGRVGRGRTSCHTTRPARLVAVHLGKLVVSHCGFEAVGCDARGSCTACCIVARQAPTAALPLRDAAHRHTTTRLHETHCGSACRRGCRLPSGDWRGNGWLISSPSGARSAWFCRCRSAGLQRNGRTRRSRCRPWKHGLLRLVFRRAPREHAHYRRAHAAKRRLRLLCHQWWWQGLPQRTTGGLTQKGGALTSAGGAFRGVLATAEWGVCRAPAEPDLPHHSCCAAAPCRPGPASRC